MRTGTNQRYTWADSLRDPCNKGARVPDPFTMIPTGVFQTQDDQILYAQSHGMVGMIIDANTFTAFIISDNATFEDFDWTTAGPIVIDAKTNTQLRTMTAKWRVVSACIELIYTGTTAQDSGQIYGFCATGAQIGASTKVGYTTRYIPTSSNQVSEFPGTNQFPVRNGMRIVWYPQDTVSATNFTNVASDQGFQSTSNSYLGFFATGMTENATVSVRTTINYEYIPSSDAFDIVPTSRPNPSTSPADWQKAWNWVADKADKVTPLFGGWSGAANAAAQLIGSRLFNGQRLSMTAPAA